MSFLPSRRGRQLHFFWGEAVRPVGAVHFFLGEAVRRVGEAHFFWEETVQLLRAFVFNKKYSEQVFL